MFDLKWSESEKKAARGAYEKAMQAVGLKIISEFKRRADAVTDLSGSCGQ